MKAMILSAGKGERMRPLTNTLPKPLLPIKGKALIEYHIEALAKAGVKDIVINVSHLANTIIEKLGDGHHYGVNLHYSFEKEPLETGGGIFQALPLLGDDPFVVVSADIFTDYDFMPLTNMNVDAAHLVLVDNPPFHTKGDFALQEGKILNSGEPMLNFAGISVLSPNLFKGCSAGKFNLAPLLRKAIDNNTVTGEYYIGQWYNIGTKEVYQEVEAVVG